jgi:hypothetical protein
MIFVNYRAEDSGVFVKHLSDRLIDRYGQDRVFVGLGIAPGEKWTNRIREELRRCKVLLAIIGSLWGEVRFEAGHRRAGYPKLSNEEDWVRQEICAAVERINDRDNPARVIVVRVDGATLPSTVWDCALDELPRLQHLHFETGRRFETDFQRLVGALEGAVPELRRVSVGEVATEEASPATIDSMVRHYAESELRRSSRMHLPLTREDGGLIPVDIDNLRVTLPLVLTQRVDASLSEVLESDGVLPAYDRHRRLHTESLNVERKASEDLAETGVTLDDYFAPGRRLIVVGAPGSGKSTLLQWVAYSFAKFYLDGGLATAIPTGAGGPLRFPIRIQCSEHVGVEVPSHFSALLLRHLQLRQFSETTTASLVTFLGTLLERGQALLLIDGLDEIPALDKRLDFGRLLVSLAEGYPETSILVTSRPVGFQPMGRLLASNYDQALIGPLGMEAKAHYVRQWARRAERVDVEDSLLRRVVADRHLAALTDTVLTLATAVQILAMEREQLPLTRIELYHRTVRLMIERSRPCGGHRLTPNEVLPHLEHLAFELRSRGLQRCSEREAIDAFEVLRTNEDDERDLLECRPPRALLDAIIESVGLLNVIGTETDERGFDRRMVQFSHQSFQEYFAGQAIMHGRIGSDLADVVDRFRDCFDAVEVVEREVDFWNNASINEHVVADYWQETFRLMIADLGQEAADRALHVVLPAADCPPGEAKARTVFALLCLADDPKVSLETVDAVTNTVVSNLSGVDAWGQGPKTWMDEAILAASKSKSGARIELRLLDLYVEASPERRRMIGGSVMLPMTVGSGSGDAAEVFSEIVTEARAGTERERLRAYLRCTNECFSYGGRLGFLSSETREAILDSLMNGIINEEYAVRTAVCWAMAWLTGAYSRQPDTENVVRLSRERAVIIEELALDPEMCGSAVADCALILSREGGVEITFEQRDWVYDLATVADGKMPRRSLEPPSASRDRAAVGWIEDALRTEPLTSSAAKRLAQALGAFGVFVEPIVEPLVEMFQRSEAWEPERSEAMFYLALEGSDRAVAALIEAANTDPEAGENAKEASNSEFLYSRGLFGLLLLDDVDVLAGQIEKQMPHSDLNAYAFGLAGSRNPRGLEILSEFRTHEAPAVRKAAEAAWDRMSDWSG